MDRRQFVGAGFSIAGSGLMSAQSAFAQNKQIIVANWGGDWNERTVKYIEAPLLESKGFKIVHDLSTTPQRRTKIIAEKRLPRGTVDVAHMSSIDAYSLDLSEALDPIDFRQIPNGSDLVEQVKAPYFVPWLYSTWEIMYNPEKIKDVPTSFNDLWDPRYVGRVGVTNQHYAGYIQAASMAVTGKPHDFEAAKKKLLELKLNSKPKVYESHQQIAVGFKTGDVWIACNFRARILQFQADGLQVATAFPKEGSPVTTFGVVLPKRSANKEGAYTYMNALLDPQALSNLCQSNFYLPASNKVDLPGPIGAKIALNAEQRKKLLAPDLAYLAKNDAANMEWWNKEFV